METLTMIIIAILLIIILFALMFVPQKNQQHERPTLRVITQPGHTPMRAHDDDAGLDLRATESVHLAPGERALVGTGVQGAVPAGYVGFITPRSGLAHKHGVAILNAPGTIDSGYRGEVKVNLINLGSSAHVIRKGDRVAQIVLMPFTPMPVVEVEHLDTTERGDGGHGSTGN